MLETHALEAVEVALENCRKFHRKNDRGLENMISNLRTLCAIKHVRLNRDF